MPDRFILSCALRALLGLAITFGAAFATVALLQPARAASHEQFIEMCRQAHMEQLRDCVRGKVGNPRQAIGDELEKARYACGAVFVRPCVLADEQTEAAGGRAPASLNDAA